MDKARKKALKRAVRQGERDLLRRKLPASPEALVELIVGVQRALSISGCDHSYRLLDRECEALDLDERAVTAWVEELGFYCDCSVAVNAWRVVEEAEKGVVSRDV